MAGRDSHGDRAVLHCATPSERRGPFSWILAFLVIAGLGVSTANAQDSSSGSGLNWSEIFDNSESSTEQPATQDTGSESKQEKASADEVIYPTMGPGQCRVIHANLGWQRVKFSGTSNTDVRFNVKWTVDKELSTYADEDGHAGMEMSTLKPRKKEKYSAKHHFGALLIRQGDNIYSASWVSNYGINAIDGYADFRINEKDGFLSDNAGVAILAFGDDDELKGCVDWFERMNEEYAQ